LLVDDQGCGSSSTREPYREVIAQAKHRIVPTRVNKTQWQMRQVWVLIG
jgi:hypothetical protein